MCVWDNLGVWTYIYFFISARRPGPVSPPLDFIAFPVQKLYRTLIILFANWHVSFLLFFCGMFPVNIWISLIIQPLCSHTHSGLVGHHSFQL